MVFNIFNRLNEHKNEKYNDIIKANKILGWIDLDPSIIYY